ncbi:MAG: hypothetical protein WB762_36070, partial [Candidatus Sulfotelmatobacter sp.]
PRSGFHPWSCGLSLIRRTAVCGPACTVVWQGRRGDPSPYADLSEPDGAAMGLVGMVSYVTIRRDLSHSKVVVEASKGKLR